jgi:hypothetical protein
MLNIRNQLSNNQSDTVNTPTLPKNEGYSKKILGLKKRAVFGLSIFGGLLLATTTTILYNKLAFKDKDEEVRYFNEQINDLKNKITNSETWVSDLNNYKKIWNEAGEKRKNFDDAKISDINISFESSALKNNLSEKSIKISTPEVLKGGIYNGQSFDVRLVALSITFNALTDKDAISFIKEFTESMSGYVILNDLEIKKNKKDGYSENDLINISTGQINGLTSVKANFSWYFLTHKNKPIDTKQ